MLWKSSGLHVDIAELQRVGQAADGALFAAMPDARVASEDLVRRTELVIDLGVVSLELVKTAEVAFKVVVRSVRGNVADAARLPATVSAPALSRRRDRSGSPEYGCPGTGRGSSYPMRPGVWCRGRKLAVRCRRS